MGQDSKEHFLEYHIQAQYPLFSNKCAYLIDELNELLDKVEQDSDDICGVILYYDGLCTDLSEEFVTEGLCHEFIVDLQARMIRYLSLLARIRSANKPCVFVSKSLVADSWLELALSCHARLSFDTKVCYQYYYIDLGLYPPGLNFLELSLKKKKSEDTWINRSKKSVTSLQQDGIIQVCCKSNHWQESSRKWLRENIGSIESNPISIQFPNKQDLKNISTNIKKWEFDKKPWSESSNPLRFIQRVVEQKSWFNDDEDFIQFLAYYMSKQLLVNEHLKRMHSMHMIKNHEDRFLHSDQFIQNPVYINLNHLSPPISVIKQLFESNIPITFYSSSSSTLQLHMDRLYVKLEKDLSSEKAKELWQRWVCWKVDEIGSRRHLQVHWGFHDELQFMWQDQKYNFYRLEGNLYESDPGVCEFVEQDQNQFFDAKWTYLFAPLTTRVIRTKPVTDTGLPCYVWIRSIVLQEILKISNHYKIDIEDVLKILKKRGWGFIADEDRWMRFLQSRYSVWSTIDTEATLIKSYGPKKPSWHMNMLKQGKQIDIGGICPMIGFMDMQIHVHFAALACTLVHILEKNQLVETLNSANLLVASAIGFPKELGEPKIYGNYFGLRRLQYYVSRNWPEFLKD